MALTGGFLPELFGYVGDIVFAVVDLIDFLLVWIEADDPDPGRGKRDGKGQSDLAESDDGDAEFLVGDFI